MAAGHRTKGVRRKPKQRGKPSAFSGLRIVFSAAAITVVLLLLAFGSIGMLMMARGPQEPLASKLDTNPPLVVSNNETPPALVTAPEPVAAPVDPLLIPAPEPIPFATQDELEREEAALPPMTQAEAQAEAETEAEPVAEPETTASVPSPSANEEPEAEQQPAIVPPRRNTRRYTPPRQQRSVRRTYKKKSEPQSQNPFTQLFGIRQYR